MFAKILPGKIVSRLGWIIGLCLFLAGPQTLLAQPDEKFDYLNKNPLPVSESEVNAQKFFTDPEVLRFTLSINYLELLKDRGDEREYHKAVVTYKDENGAIVAVDAKVMVRGNHRRNPAICRFPPLTLNFSRKTTANTWFQEVNKLKLVTHCLGDDYLLREYLIYKLYNFLTDYSFRVRLCQIDYIDVESKRKTESKYAFLIEDDKQMAQRNKATLIPRNLFITMDKTNPQVMARLALFQYLIGNTDWSVPYRHNIKLLDVGETSAPIPVPYDFDYCGLVGAPYAVPPPELGITSVRQRLYRGYHFPEEVYAGAISSLNSQRDNLYNIYQQSPLLDKSYRKQTLNYFDSFYKTINTPKNFQNSIVRVGQQNLKKYVVIKGLK